MRNTIALIIDTEFTDFANMGLISIGAVAEHSDEEFYAEVSDHKAHWRSKFVNEIVMPFTDMEKFGRPHKQVAIDWANWIDSLDCEEVLIVGDYIGDFQLLGELYSIAAPKKTVKNIMINQYLGDKLVAYTGKDTLDQYLDCFNNLGAILAEEFKNPLVRQHHALDDAKVSKIAFKKALQVYRGL